MSDIIRIHDAELESAKTVHPEAKMLLPELPASKHPLWVALEAAQVTIKDLEARLKAVEAKVNPPAPPSMVRQRVV